MPYFVAIPAELVREAFGFAVDDLSDFVFSHLSAPVDCNRPTHHSSREQPYL
jgi:hypothetical protein